nr:hypothetical protein [Brevundimonas diminuta]
MTVTLHTEVLAIILASGAAWGFVRLACDAILGAANLSLWVHRRLVERRNDR